MERLPDVIASMARQIEDIRRRDRGREREGKVVAIDEARGLYRVNVAREGGQLVTPWIPVEALSSGALKIQGEPVEGQTVRVLSPSGDMTDAIVSLSSFDDTNQRPHGKAGELKITVGATEITGTADSLTLRVGGSSIEITDGKITATGDTDIVGATAITGSGLTHNGTNVGDDHRHRGVSTGSGTTDEPL